MNFDWVEYDGLLQVLNDVPELANADVLPVRIAELHVVKVAWVHLVQVEVIQNGTYLHPNVTWQCWRTLLTHLTHRYYLSRSVSPLPNRKRALYHSL